MRKFKRNGGNSFQCDFWAVRKFLNIERKYHFLLTFFQSPLCCILYVSERAYSKMHFKLHFETNIKLGHFFPILISNKFGLSYFKTWDCLGKKIIFDAILSPTGFLGSRSKEYLEEVTSNDVTLFWFQKPPDLLVNRLLLNCLNIPMRAWFDFGWPHLRD